MGVSAVGVAVATGALAVLNAAAGVDYQCPAERDEEGSMHKGGSMVTSGSNTSLPRVSYHLDVHIEDGFARTTVDQVYYNTQGWRQEGKYRFPIPRGASISRLAMYVKGQRLEGGMVERKRAAEVYRDIRYKRRDPVLLEWVDGNTFEMRVFPIEPYEHKRIIISYTQRLVSENGKWIYRFPGADPQETGKWSAKLRLKGGARSRPESPSHEFDRRLEGEDLVLSCEKGAVSPEGSVELSIRKLATPAARFEVMEVGGARYAMLRWRPELAARVAQPKDCFVVFEASADRDPVVARRQISVLRALCEARAGAGMRIVVANTASEEIADGQLDELDNVQLIGALDLGKAFERVRRLAAGSQSAVVVHLGGGNASLGERGNEGLANMLPGHAVYVGAGIGRGWNRSLMERCALRSGGVFGEVDRAEDLLRLVREATSSRLGAIEVTGRDGRVKFLTAGEQVAKGDELLAVARLDEGEILPDEVRVRARLVGNRWERSIEANWKSVEAGYLPRIWARREIDRMVASGGEAHRDRIVALSQSMHVMSPFTSLLVLESAEMHREYGVRQGTEHHWAKYPAPLKMELLPKPARRFLEPVPAAAPAPAPRPAPAPVAPQPWERRGGVELEAVPVEFPKPMFVGTPVAIRRPNLEGMGARVPAAATAWRPMFAGQPVSLQARSGHPFWSNVRRNVLVPKGSRILSRGATVTSSDEAPIIGDLEMITDGDKDGADGSYVELMPGKQWVQIDIGERKEIWSVLLWHFHKNCRAYDDVVIQLSDDPEFRLGVETIFNNDFDNSSGFGIGGDPAWVETNYGRIFEVDGRRVRYVRFYSNGNTANEMNHYIEVEIWGRDVGDGDERFAEAWESQWEELAEMEARVEREWLRQKGLVHLEWLRRSHSMLLAAMANAARTTAPGEIPEDLMQRARRIADRWWGVDGGSPRACQLAATVMRQIGRRDLEWAYLTTPVALSGGNGNQWLEVVCYGERNDDPVLAELARRELAGTLAFGKAR